MVYTQAYENSATLYIRQPDELPADFEVAKGCFATKAELLDQWEDTIKQEFGQELYIVRADDYFLELLHPNVNKGNGLKELTENLVLLQKKSWQSETSGMMFLCLTLLGQLFAWVMALKKRKSMLIMLPLQMTKMASAMLLRNFYKQPKTSI